MSTRDDVLAPDNVRDLVSRWAAALSDQPDEVQVERARLASDIDQLDQRIRKIGLQVVDGVLATEDAKALNAPLIARRDAAKLRLAALPQRQSTAPAIDPDKFRGEILTAWGNRPLDERRATLDRIIEKITLSEGGAHVDYRIKDAEVPFHQADPSGPPEGSAPINRAWVMCGGVSSPKVYVTAAL